MRSRGRPCRPGRGPGWGTWRASRAPRRPRPPRRASPGGPGRPDRRRTGRSLARHEREVGVAEVARPPAERQRVEGDDDRGVAGSGRALDEARGDLLVADPSRAGTSAAPGRRLGHLLERVRGRGGEDEGNAQRGRGPRGGELALGMRDREDADRREEERQRRPRPEHLDREAPLGVPTRHPRAQPIPLERRPVRPDRRLGAAPPACSQRSRRERLLRPPLPFLRRDGPGGLARGVDRVLDRAPSIAIAPRSYGARAARRRRASPPRESSPTGTTFMPCSPRRKTFSIAAFDERTSATKPRIPASPRVLDRPGMEQPAQPGALPLGIDEVARRRRGPSRGRGSSSSTRRHARAREARRRRRRPSPRRSPRWRSGRRLVGERRQPAEETRAHVLLAQRKNSSWRATRCPSYIGRSQGSRPSRSRTSRSPPTG